MNSRLKYISSQVILARISPLLVETNWREDAMLWLGDAIQEMGYKWSTEIKATPEDDLIQIVNHIAEIPCEWEEILEVHYNGNRIPISTDVSMLALSTDEYQWKGTGEWYMLQHPYIKTSFEEGELKVIFNKFRMDEKGFVMVPDNTFYIDAVRWKVLYNLGLSGYTFKNPSINVQYCEEKYEEKKREAKGVLNQMSRDRRAQFSRLWTSIDVSMIGRNNLRT